MPPPERQTADSVRTAATLFSGIGGDALGLERAGYRLIWFAETESLPEGILSHRWPEVPNYGDVTMIDWSTLERPHVLAGGFPCQDISNAHTRTARRALAGPRSGLWTYFLTAIDVLEPAWVIVENVAAQERWVPEVRADLAGIGYASLPVELSAGTFGAPHKRPRVFLVAHPDGDSQPLRSLDEEVARLRPLPRGSGDWRCPPPDGFRMAHGVPGGMDRLRAVGNSVAPACVEFLARWIAQSDGPGAGGSMGE
jgi:DNA (cytosine-5)-methyltransferase 1